MKGNGTGPIARDVAVHSDPRPSLLALRGAVIEVIDALSGWGDFAMKSPHLAVPNSYVFGSRLLLLDGTLG